MHAGRVAFRKRRRSRRPIAKHPTNAFLGKSRIPYVAAHLGCRPAMTAQNVENLLSSKRIRGLNMPEMVSFLPTRECLVEGIGGDVTDPMGNAGILPHSAASALTVPAGRYIRTPSVIMRARFPALSYMVWR